MKHPLPVSDKADIGLPVIIISQNTAESEKENLLKLGYNNKVAVIANGIEVDDIMIKSTWTKKYKILFLSRVHVKKGIELLIEASARIKRLSDNYSRRRARGLCTRIER